MPIINNLSGNEIEILKLADFLTGVEHDITDVYFGELQIFTVWAETEGTLPLTINANGEALIDYKIYGNMTQNGTPTPSDPIYPSECGEKTGNIFNMDESAQGYGYTANKLMVTGGTIDTNAFFISEYIPVIPGQTYTYFTDLFRTVLGVIKFYNVVNGAVTYLDQTPQKNVPSSVSYSPSECVTFTVPTNTSQAVTHIRISVDKESTMFFIIEGSTAPASYIPYGYRVPMYVRGENLFDGEYPNIIADTPRYRAIYVGDGDFTLSTTTPLYGQAAVLFFLAGNVSSGASTNSNGVWTEQDRTVTAINGYVTIAYRYYINTDPRDNDTMLNSGSTALPYQPYSRTDTPIYLGEVQTTRRIKKLVLDGTESWTEYASDLYRLRISTYGSGVTGQGISSHFISVDSTSGMPDNSFVSGENFSYIKNTSAGSLTGWQTYLAQQYANGTPVTIWYVLAEPTTGTLYEPLRKIGNYVDSVSGTSLPTLNGTTVYDADLVTKPSKMYVKYRKNGT